MKSINQISTDNPKRWFVVSDSDIGELAFILFGYVGAIHETELTTGQPNIFAFLTEDELEIYLDNIAGVGYYKEAVETQSEKFQGPSQKY